MIQDETLLHNRRQVVRFNRKESNAINEYCRRFGITTPKSALFRKIIMEKVLTSLDESNPTLF